MCSSRPWPLWPLRLHSSTILCLLSLAVGIVFCSPPQRTDAIDNALIGQPNISCHPDTIEMRFRTKRPFTGKIYVQGHFTNPDCRVDFSQAGGADHDGRGGIRLHHGSCDMDRRRMVNEGMQFSTVLVISFHPLFVTKTDRAFHINCMYREENQNVGADMTVGDVTPANIQNDMPVPNCHYTIRKDALDGEVLKYARVGDLIVHRWECEAETYGMLVHSCFVEDGQGDRVEVIDERGCHKDSNVLGDPTYSEALNLAYRESYVFKFRDRLGVRFSCEIKLCVKADDGCADITPPDCQGVRFQNNLDDPSSRNQSSLAAKNRIRRSPPKTVDADLISQYVFVLDEPVEGEEQSDNDRQRAGLLGASGSSAVCMSSALFTVLVVAVMLTFGIATAVVGHAICRRIHSAGSDFRDGFSCSSRTSPTATLFLKR